MTRVRGTVVWGGTVGYCPQTAWIQNATLVSFFPFADINYSTYTLQRENILFGQPWDEEKYWKVIETSCLLADLDTLPAGDQTEV
jgi:ATP-binding cassette, subfamily C (CFTR/MRP), member 1